MSIRLFLVHERHEAERAVNLAIGEPPRQGERGGDTARIVVRPRRTRHRVVMRPDDDDLLWPNRSQDFGFHVVAPDIGDFVLLAFCLVSNLPELGLDIIRRLRQLLRTVPHIPLANVNSEVSHVLAQLISERHQFVRLPLAVPRDSWFQAYQSWSTVHSRSFGNGSLGFTRTSSASPVPKGSRRR